MNNVKKSIGWADYTWNPVTGCKRKCEYCYARKIHRRFNKYLFSEIRVHPNRFDEVSKVKDGSKIFVGSMSDIQYWETETVSQIIKLCAYYFTKTYMFLSKSAFSYGGFSWPVNTMQGLTVEIPSNGLCKNHINVLSAFRRPFLSIEPIAGGVWSELPKSIELVIVGAMTGNGKNNIIPQKQWLKSIKDHVPSEKIYWKNNIKKYLEEYGLC